MDTMEEKYSKLEDFNKYDSMFDYSLLSSNEIKESTGREIDQDTLHEINEILDIIFNKLSSFKNVFVMTQFLQKYFDKNSTIILNVKSNIVAKNDPRTTGRNSFELYREIFNEIVVSDIKDMIMKNIKNINSSQLLTTLFKNNEPLYRLYIKYNISL